MNNRLWVVLVTVAALASAQLVLQPGQTVYSTNGICTLGFPAGWYTFVTAGHCFPVGTPVYVNGYYIGYVSKVEVLSSKDPNNPSTDMGAIALVQQNTVAYNPTLYQSSSECRRLTADPYIVKGYALESSQLFWVGAPVIFNGALSGCIVLRVRYLPGTYPFTDDRGNTYYTRAFLVDVRTVLGDSGGPAALTDGSYLYQTPVWIGGTLIGQSVYNGGVYDYMATVQYGSLRIGVIPTPQSWR